MSKIVEKKFLFFSCVGTQARPSAKIRTRRTKIFFFFSCVGTKAPPAAKMPWGVQKF